jgi:hypothetical protein
MLMDTSRPSVALGTAVLSVVLMVGATVAGCAAPTTGASSSAPPTPSVSSSSPSSTSASSTPSHSAVPTSAGPATPSPSASARPAGDQQAISACQAAIDQVGGASAVIAGFRVSEGVYDEWRLVHDGQGSGLHLSFAPTELSSTVSVNVCYFSGLFEISQPIPGPLPDIVRARVDQAGALVIDEVGHTATVAPQRPQAP